MRLPLRVRDLSARSLLRRQLHSERARRVRQALLGPPLVRRLVGSDLPRAWAFVRRHLWIDQDFLAFHLQNGTAFAAFDRFQKLRGIGFLDQYTRTGMTVEGWWIRAVAVSRRARGLGYGHALVHELVDEAKHRGFKLIHAAIEPENTSSLKLFEACGFTWAPETKRKRILERWRESRDEREWAVLEAST